MAQTCHFTGNSDMYGLGIRTGYYLQWYTSLLAAWLCPHEVPTLRLTNTFFVASTFLALLTLVPKPGNLEIVEIYITLLFTFGSSMYLLPVLLWRLATRFNPQWDPSRFPKARPPSLVYQYLDSGLTMAVLSFQIWFWVSKVPDLDAASCVQYGFLFTKTRLNARSLRIWNLTLAALLLALLCGFTLVAPWRERVSRKLNHRYNTGPSPRTTTLFRLFDTLSKTLVATTIIAATELCIHWNAIAAVNAINGAGQTIPLVIGIGNFVRTLYLALKKPESTQGGHAPDVGPLRFVREYGQAVDPLVIPTMGMGTGMPAPQRPTERDAQPMPISFELPTHYDHED